MDAEAIRQSTLQLVQATKQQLGLVAAGDGRTMVALRAPEDAMAMLGTLTSLVLTIGIGCIERTGEAAAQLAELNQKLDRLIAQTGAKA